MSEPVQAVILAGGLGTRLGPLTQYLPKPMVPVAGVPYLEHQLSLLRRQDILDVLLLTGHLGERIEEYFGDGSRFGLTIRYSREGQPLGTAGGLREARELLADSFLLLYGDSYLPIAYREVHQRLLHTGAQGLMVVYDNQLSDTSVTSNVGVDETGYVTIYEKDSDQKLPFVEAGVLSFRKSLLDLIPPAGVVSLEREIFPVVIGRHQLAAQITRQRFYDIGTPDRLRAFENFLANDHHADTISN